MAVSAAFTFAGAAGSLQKLAVAASTAWSATLDNVAGVVSVEWEIVSTDETTAPSDYTLVASGPRGSTVSSTSLTAGTAAILRCLVNRGRADQASARAKVGVLTAGGLWVGAFDEELEHDPVYGSTEIVNAAVRAAGSISATPSVTRITLTGDATTARTVGTEASGRLRVFETSLQTVPHFGDIAGLSPYRYYYPSGIAAATELTPPIWLVDQGRLFDCVVSFSIYPSAALTADDTDYAAIEILNEAGTVIFVAETTLTSDNATGDWTDSAAIAIPTLADPGVFAASLVAGAGMKFRVRKFGAGIALPAFTVVPYFTYTP